MSKPKQEIDFNDDSEFLEKDIQRKAGALARKKQEEEFEKDSSSGKFKIVSYIVETIGALFLVGYILWDIWVTSGDTSIGRLIVIGIVVLIFSTFVARYISKYYYMKGKTKRFKFFNTVSKVSEVSLSIADAVTPGGNKMLSRIENTQGAISDVISHTNKLSTLDDDGGIYKESDYDSYRRKCYNAGFQVIYESKEESLIKNVKAKIAGIRNLPSDVKRDLLMTLFIIKDFKSGECKDIIDEKLYISLIGALYYFNGGDDTASNLIPNFIPGIGYTDDMFMLNCVLAANIDSVKKYKGWRYMEKKKKTANLEKEIIQDLIKVGDNCYSSGTVNLIVKTATNVPELSKYVELFNKSINKEISKILVGLFYYWTCREDIINDDIPHIGKADDAYVLSVVSRTLRAKGTAAEKVTTTENRNLDDALSNLTRGGTASGC